MTSKQKNQPKTKGTIENQTKERYVAFFDILGFKKTIEKGTIHAAKKLQSLILYLHEFTDKYDVQKHIKFKVFSDSIFMYTEDNSPTSWRLFTYSICCILNHALTLENPIPIKCGIAYGEAFVGHYKSPSTKDIICGTSITDAYLIQEQLQYIGIVLHHTFEERLEVLKEDYAQGKIYDKYLESNFERVIALYQEALTPLKLGKYTHCNINLFKFEASWATDFHQKSDSILNKLKLTSSSESRKYIDNTRTVWNELKPQKTKLNVKVRSSIPSKNKKTNNH